MTRRREQAGWRLFAGLLALLFIGGPSLRAAEEGADARLVVVFFYKPGCPLCQPTKRIVQSSEKHFGRRIRVIWFDYSLGEERFIQYLEVLDARGIEETPDMSVFAGDAFIGGGERIIANLQAMIERALEKDPLPEPVLDEATLRRVEAAHAAGATAPLEKELDREQLAKHASLLSERGELASIIVPALADGVNPCAFATVILFVSMLSTLGHERRNILLVGIVFIVAVFIAYFAIGLFVFEGLRRLMKEFMWVESIITWGALALAGGAGLLSLVDAVQAYRTAGKGKMLLVLPDSIKDRIRKQLRKAAHASALIWGAFVAGILVSFLEAACTGQVYFPVITLLIKNENTRFEGVLKLLLYNVLFILPLMAVFIAAYVGISSEAIANAARKRVWLTKLALGVVFIALAGWLGYMMIMSTRDPGMVGKPAAVTTDHSDR